jgi:RecA-family ATPase
MDGSWLDFNDAPSQFDPDTLDEATRERLDQCEREALALDPTPEPYNADTIRAEIEAKVAGMSEQPIHDGTAQPPDPAAVLKAAAMDWNALAGRRPPRRRFAWNPWMPAGKVAVLNGSGAVGKTLLAQQLATAYALGRPLFGGETEGGPVLVIAAEDDHDEVWQRQLDICVRFGIDDPSQIKGLMIVPDFGAADMTLARVDTAGKITTTMAFEALRQTIAENRPGLTVLDNAAILFAISEIDRMQVTRCIGLLRSLCHEFATSILLLCHNNKTGDFSGSTAWENAVRTRLSMARNHDDATIVTLSRPKANYAANGETKMRWCQGSFRSVDEEVMTDAERLDAAIERRAHADVFLEALDTLTARQRNLSISRNAANYAPKVMIECCLSKKLTQRQLEDAMELLLDEQRIEPDVKLWKGENRHTKYGLARTGNVTPPQGDVPVPPQDEGSIPPRDEDDVFPHGEDPIPPQDEDDLPPQTDEPIKP